jgi:hypothetical protein
MREADALARFTGCITCSSGSSWDCLTFEGDVGFDVGHARQAQRVIMNSEKAARSGATMRRI